ncbi:hypothetical protein [Vibrio sp. 1CM24A]|uniref:hypothetical protein n=1 Tax=Vibrio sp. 1CM24A TaxID=2929165 RepID=UPI0020C1492B|nr:hypothetical protein [Vibrio sp. 1CM24A]MCK8083658.1 hypothetical protein [Vibrio sp. 1CM24A]
MLRTSLFMVPADASSIAVVDVLWAWWFLTIVVRPVAITLAVLGRRYPYFSGTPTL